MARTTRDDIWPVVHAEREALVRDLEPVAREKWATPSLCEGWDVHDAVAHLVDDARTTRLGFVRHLVAARFDFDRCNAAGIARERHDDPALTLAALRAVLARTTSAPAPLPTRLVEAFVHGEDIRRPLAIRRDYPTSHVATALRHQVGTSVKLGGGRERAEGLRLVADDADLVLGGGPEVRGPVVSLLLAVSGRVLPPDELNGPGAAALTGRR